MQTRVAESDAVAAKAAGLAVRYERNGQFSVASGTTVGRVYTVCADHNLDDVTGWQCTCDWADHGGRCCSHVQAAARWARREKARIRRARADAERGHVLAGAVA